MKYGKIIAVLAAILFFGAVGHASASLEKNTPTKIDWQVQKEWKLPSPPLDVVYSLDQKHVFVLTEQHQVIVYNDSGKVEGTIPVSAGVKAIDISPRGENLYLIDSEKKTFTALAVDFVYNINTAGSPMIGHENAPVTIVEFSDFECPYCREAVSLIDQILKKNPDTVKFYYKNFPLTSIHRFAEMAATAAMAAKEQGKFWEFYKELYSAPGLSSDVINGIAEKLKLDIPRFQADMASAKIRQEVVQDLKDGDAAGVTGTPTIFVNGHLLKNRSLQGFQQMIDEELKKAHSKH